MQTEIIEFMESYKVATLCCASTDGEPYCFHCFYVYDARLGMLFFKSSDQTEHVRMLALNPHLSGSILPDKAEFLTLKGLQFCGILHQEPLPNGLKAADVYHKKFPFALAMPGKVWCVEITMVKLTDNTRIFGKKLRWDKVAQHQPA